MSLLQVKNISKAFGGVQALSQVSFDLQRGQMLALLGPNGAGKSTCFNLLNGQLRPDSGSIVFDGHEIGGKTPRAIWHLGVGRTFQIAATFASLTVLENVQMALLSRERKLFRFWQPAAAYYRDEAMALLEQVGMEDQAGRACNRLAYGDIKRAELAIALANRPALLLMDEPAAGMAQQERYALMALTRKLVTENKLAVLFTEHSMDVVFAFADRMIVLARGELIAAGDGAAIRNDPKVQAVYFGSGKTFEKAAPSTANTGGQEGAAQTGDGNALLSVAGLSGWYDRARILFDVTLEIRRGEVVALLGRNGAGKSTTIKAIMGLLARTEGTVQFAGRDIGSMQPHRIARLGIGYVPEDRRIFGDLSVLENLETGRRPPSPDGVHWTPQKLFALFPNLGEMPHRLGSSMSGGEQQMLAVARTLMGNPSLLLLDEPSEGVAPLIVEQMADMILALKRAGVAILLSEQNLHFAALVSDRAYVLENGHVRYGGSMAALAADDTVRDAYLSV